MSQLSNSSSPAWKTFTSDGSSHLFVVGDSRVYDITNDVKQKLDCNDSVTLKQLSSILKHKPLQSMQVPEPLPPQSISLNVSSSCNLGCAYCYASKGSFNGAQQEKMSWATARNAIDKLLSSSDRNAPVTIGYLGGEPFINRSLIHKATHYSINRGQALNQDVRFSVTTNGTILNKSDRQLMRSHRFAVTISIDGGKVLHEQQRKGADFSRLKHKITPLLKNPGQAQINARATVTRNDFSLLERFDAIRELGFRDIGFAPVRVGSLSQALHGQDWNKYFDAFIKLGSRELERLKNEGHSAFSNLVIALKQIHRGACSPYPCGAGGGYFSVAANGDWYACHRAIGNRQFLMGNNSSIDQGKRKEFLNHRHVHNQTDCQTCWAKYLCSGSCHQEAKSRNPDSCNFIRRWLEFCLSSYSGLTAEQQNKIFIGGSK